MPQLCRSLFLGFDEFGSNVVFELKKRLSKIRIKDDNFLLSLENLDQNPFQFLHLYTSSFSGKDLGDRFFRYSITGDDLTLVNFAKECIFTEENQGSQDLFVEALKRLTNFHADHFYKNTGISISAYEPAAIFIFDIEEVIKNGWADLIEQKVLPKDKRIADKYHSHAVIRIEDKEANLDTINEMKNNFHNIFLLSNDSELILDKVDHINIAVNYLSVMAQSDLEKYKTYFNNAVSTDFYALGSTQIYFPKEEMIIDSTKKTFEDDEFSSLFVGNFRKIKPEDEDLFSFGRFEEESKIEKGEISEEIIPEVRDSIINRTQSLMARTENWLNSHIDRIRSEFNRNVFIERVKQLTKPSHFFKTYLSKWKDNFDALEFLFKYEIFGSAKDKAALLKDEFLLRWQDEAEALKGEINKVQDENNNLVCTHNGELAWNFCVKYISNLKKVILPQLEKKEIDTEYQPAEPPSRKELEKLVDKFPSIQSILTRGLFLIIVFLFFWKGVHVFLNKWIFSNDLILSPWLSGLIVLCLILGFIYWFNYRRKIIILWEKLSAFLRFQREKFYEKVNKIEREMLTDLYLETGKLLRKSFSTRPGFFYHAISRDRIDFNDLVQEGYAQFENPPNLVESFYLNRIQIFKELKETVKGLDRRKNKSELIKSIPSDKSVEYTSQVDDLVENFGDYKEIFHSVKYSEAFGLYSFWITEDKDESIKRELLNVLISRCGQLMRDELSKYDEYKDLISYILSQEKMIGRAAFSQLSEMSKPTYQIDSNSVSDYKVFASSYQIFDESQKQKCEKILDQNNVIFLSIDGPFSFTDISGENK
jgi:hypothetical protein